MCMGGLSAYRSMHHVLSCCLWRRASDTLELQMVVTQQLNPGPLEGALTAEPSSLQFQLSLTFFSTSEHYLSKWKEISCR